MNPTKTTGLGEPELTGKKSLFQPPSNVQTPITPGIKQIKPVTDIRLRLTLELTKQSIAIIQDHQSQYRLEHGHALPKWKIISDALVLYDKERKGEGSENQ